MNDQDDEKKIIEEERSQSETENQSKVDENNQPEGVDNQKNDLTPDSNQNNNENNDQTQNLDTSSEKKEENEILDNQNNERSLESSQNNDQETTQQQTSETSSEKKVEDNGSSHEVIHKKDGRLHIYIRQDKYKGELKSKNWVGRLYHDGKQKISSSGTPNLEEAIPILDLKKLVTFFESSLVLSDGFETELFSKKLGFLNLIFFILSKKANFDFLFSCSSSGD